MTALHDQGRGLERTRFAWRRTALAATVVALLAGRLALSQCNSPLGAAAIALLWLAALAVCARRIRATGSSPVRPAGRSLSVLACAIVGYAILGALLVLG